MSTDPEANLILQKLREFRPEVLEEAQTFRGEITIYIQAAAVRAVGEFLRDTPGLNFNFLADLTAVDLYPNEPRFDVVYHLLSLETGERLRLKARISGDNPQIDSVVPVWPAAYAYEREVFDLFGIQFAGHPFLRRIVLPEEWEGHPLRKDYPTEGYR